MKDLEKRIEELETTFKKLEELVLSKCDYLKATGILVEKMYKELILHEKQEKEDDSH